MEKEETPWSPLIYKSIKEATVIAVYYMDILRQTRSAFNASTVSKYTLETIKKHNQYLIPIKNSIQGEKQIGAA